MNFRHIWGPTLLFSLIYLGAAKFGLAINAYSQFISLVWPPSGLALAVLLIFGRRHWPGILLGAFLANWTTGATPLAALAIASGNALEAYFGARWTQKSATRLSFARLEDVMRLVSRAALLSTMISATIGVTSLWLDGLLATAQLRFAWLQWWVGDATGDLIVAPLLLVFLPWRGWKERLTLIQSRRRVLEAAILAISLGLCCIAALSNFLGPFVAELTQSKVYFLFPLILWAAVRFGPKGASLAIFIVATFAVWTTAHGQGPFSEGTWDVNLIHLITFVLTTSMSGLVVAAVVAEREFQTVDLEKRVRERTLKLLETEESFRLLVETIKDYAIIMLNTKGQVVSWNAGAERIKGYKAHEIIGRHISIFYPKTASVNRPERSLKIAQTVGHFEDEGWRIRKDGSAFYANVVVTALRDADGKLTGFSKITRDITARREADQRLQTLREHLEKRVVERTHDLQMRETQLRVIANAIPVLVAQMDRDERILFANEAFGRWTGYSAVELTGRQVKSILPTPLFLRIQPFLQKALTGDTTVFEIAKNESQNEPIYSFTVAPDSDEKGQITGTIAVGTDISKHKEIEIELKQAKEAADAASAAKSAFLANMSHEIRTPLGAVLGFSELMFDPGTSPAERSRYVEAVKRNGLLLSNIINDILDLSKVEAGKMEFEKVDVDIHDVLTDISSLLHLEAIEKGIQLDVSIEPSVPASIKTDPLRLRQILVNVVGNAVKFTSHGKVTVHIGTRTSTEKPQLIISVEDTGRGITNEQAKRLFTPFTQADVSTTRRFGGTGLGLALAKRLAQGLGGDLVLTKSVPDVGTMFTLAIDLEVTQSPALSEPGQRRSKPPLPTLHPPIGPLKVLLVDDSADNQILGRHLLESAGAKVDFANNGLEGVQKARTANYDLILMDLQMPEMDGVEATRRLRQEGFKLPIIAFTAHAMKAEKQRCLASGFDDYISKPIDRARLYEILGKYTSDGLTENQPS